MREFAMDKKRLGGVAYGRILRLRIDGDLCGFISIGKFVDVHMADAVGMAEDGDLGAVLNTAHHFVRAARDDEIDEIVHLQQFRDFLARRNQLHSVPYAVSVQHAAYDFADCRIGLCRFASSFEQQRVSTSDRKRCNLRPRVWTRLVDHGENSNRSQHLPQNQPLVEFGLFHNAPNRIFHCSDLLDAVNHIPKLGFVQYQSFVERLRNSRGFGFSQIFLIRFEYCAGMLAQSGRNVVERTGLEC